MTIIAKNFSGTLPSCARAYRIEPKTTNYAFTVTVHLEDEEHGGFLTEEVIIEHVHDDQSFEQARQKALSKVELSYGLKLIKTPQTQEA